MKWKMCFELLQQPYNQEKIFLVAYKCYPMRRENGMKGCVCSQGMRVNVVT